MLIIGGDKIGYQATAIQLAGERSTLLNDINPGYLWANPDIWNSQNHICHKLNNRIYILLHITIYLWIMIDVI
jgi:hypothetical protein